MNVASILVVDFKLTIEGVSEQVTVTGSPVVQTATTSIGQVISQRTVQEIPLNGRHFVDLGLLIPGSVTPPQNGFLTAPLRGQGSFAFNTAGNREDTVNFMINGVNLNDMVQNQITFQPSINTVSEFKVDNSTFSAEYGRNSGAIVNIATRSGTNDLHGEVFEFFRDDSLDSRNYFNQPPARKSPFQRNQFGGNFAGPILKNKTFFFFSYEGLRQRQGIDINSGVLRDDQRATVVDPVSRNLLPLIPPANTIGPSGEGRYVGSATAPVDIDQWTGDVHHTLNQADALHGYYAFQRDRRGEPTLQLNTIPGFGDTRHSHRQIMTLNETHVFGPGLVNEARFGFNRIDITFDPNAKLNPVDYGMNVGVTTPIGIPQVTVQGLGLNFGGPANFPQGRTNTTFVFSDSASYLRGKHTLKLGGDLTGVVNTLRPDLIGDPAILGSPNQWFNNSVCDPRIASGAGACGPSSVFAYPVSPAGVFHFGNLGRNAIYGPGFSNTDLSLIKNLSVGGGARLQFRVEAFNVFNQANLGQPGSIAIVGNTAFGVITNNSRQGIPGRRARFSSR